MGKPTVFQSRVYDVVRNIPEGRVRSYGSIAKELNTSARSVGTAMGKNAYELKDVPWHRVVASDRSIGGFCHSWGEDQPKVQEKKKMLEEEGIKFESDGMKIMKEHFIYEQETKACAKKTTTSTKQSTTRTKSNTASKLAPTALVDEITEEVLKKEILQLLNKRAPGKTCWPSEIPRALSKRGELPSGVDWRSLMEPTRIAARSLVNEDRIDVMQKGNVLPKEQEYRGPIRLRLCVSKH